MAKYKRVRSNVWVNNRFLAEGDIVEATDPVVSASPGCFEDLNSAAKRVVEEATAVPGQKRNTGRRRTGSRAKAPATAAAAPKQAATPKAAPAETTEAKKPPTKKAPAKKAPAAKKTTGITAPRG